MLRAYPGRGYAGSWVSFVASVRIRLRPKDKLRAYPGRDLVRGLIRVDGRLVAGPFGSDTLD